MNQPDIHHRSQGANFTAGGRESANRSREAGNLDLAKSKQSVASVLLNEVAPAKTYISLRDDLWRELVDLPEGAVTRYAAGVLELANKVVRILLEAQKPEDLTRNLELLRCKLCEVFVLRCLRERPRTDVRFVFNSLKQIEAPDLVAAAAHEGQSASTR
jgi:hypothetical protein